MEIAKAFFAASRSGDMNAIGAMLAADVSIHADGGGKRSAAPQPILGNGDVMGAFEFLAIRFREVGSTLVRTVLSMDCPDSSLGKPMANCRQLRSISRTERFRLSMW